MVRPSPIGAYLPWSPSQKRIEMMIHHTLCFTNPLSGDQIAFHFRLCSYDRLLFPLEPHRPCGSMSFAKAISSPPPVQLGVQPVEKLRDRKGAFQAWPAACTATTGADSFLEKSRVGGRGRGACFPVHQLVKMTFLTSCIPSSMGYRLFGFHQKAGTPHFAALRLCLLPTRSPWAACNMDMARNPTPTQNSA